MGHPYALRRIPIADRSLELRQRAVIVAFVQQRLRVGVVGHPYALRRIPIADRSLELRQRAFIVARGQQFIHLSIKHSWLDDAKVDQRCRRYNNNRTD